MHLSFKNDMPLPCSWFNALASFGVFLTPYCLRQYGLLVPYFALCTTRSIARAFNTLRGLATLLPPTGGGNTLRSTAMCSLALCAYAVHF